MMTLADRLSHVLGLAGRGVRAQSVDLLAGLTAGHTSQIARGYSRLPTAETIARIARVLSISMSWLMLGEGEPPTAEAVRAGLREAYARAGLSEGTCRIDGRRPLARGMRRRRSQERRSTV